MNYKEHILQHLEDRGIKMHPGYELEVDLLADQFRLYWEASKQSKEHGIYNKFDNGTIQRNAYACQMDKCLANIAKLADKFGLSPKALQGVDHFEPKPMSKLERLNAEFPIRKNQYQSQ